MAHKFIKAGLLTSPDGEHFIAFFDFDRLIHDIQAARNFVASIRLLTSVPAIVMYWADGQWRYLGDARHDSMIKYLMDLSDDEKAGLAVRNAVLTIPTSGPNKE